MLNEPTLEKLKTMRIDGMAHALVEQQQSTEMQRLAFDDRFGMLVDAEWLFRENRKMARNLKEAKLKIAQACIEDVEASASRGLDGATLRQLASCAWIRDHHNLLLTGLTGTGKTYVACALAQLACRRGYRALYRRVSRLFDELSLARADGSYARLLAKLARADVLILDDWGMTTIRDAERRDLLEIIDDRVQVRSTIVTSQLPTDKWHDYVGDPTVADALLDRLTSNAIRIVLKGPSRRPRKQEGTRNKKS